MTEAEKCIKQNKEIKKIIHDFKSKRLIADSPLTSLMIANLVLIEISHILKIDLLKLEM